MYAIIFRATIRELDTEYQDMVARMRSRAQDSYGCLGLVSTTEADEEITISYWDSLDQVRAWKEDNEHLVAQQKGRSRWYRDYRVQVVEILREYSWGGG